MKLLQSKTKATLIASEAFVLAFPPTLWGDVTAWDGPYNGVPAEFDLEIWANAGINLTAAELFGGSLHPFEDLTRALVNADDVFVGEADDDTLTAVAHGLITGDGPFRVSTAGSLPTGLLAATDYWVIRMGADTFKLATSLENALARTAIPLTTDGAGVNTIADTADTERVVLKIEAFDHTDESITATAHALLTGDGPYTLVTDIGTLPTDLSASVDYWVIKIDADNFSLALSLADAMAGTAVAFSTNGTGQVVLADSDTATTSDAAGTQRLHWHTHGLLGIAGDGAIALTAQKAYVERRPHRPRAKFYALIATLSTNDPEWVSVAAYPVQDA